MGKKHLALSPFCAVTAWAKTGPSGPKYQVNFGDQVSYLK